jgi:hypothetical protein
MSWRSTLHFFFEECVSVALKTAFSVFCTSTGKRATDYDVKGITLIYSNLMVVNFTNLRYVILEDAPPVHAQYPR